MRRSQPRPRHRILTGHQRQERITVDVPRQTQPGRATARPQPRRLRTVQVVPPRPLQVVRARVNAPKRRHPRRHHRPPHARVHSSVPNPHSNARPSTAIPLSATAHTAATARFPPGAAGCERARLSRTAPGELRVVLPVSTSERCPSPLKGPRCGRFVTAAPPLVVVTKERPSRSSPTTRDAASHRRVDRGRRLPRAAPTSPPARLRSTCHREATGRTLDIGAVPVHDATHRCQALHRRDASLVGGLRRLTAPHAPVCSGRWHCSPDVRKPWRRRAATTSASAAAPGPTTCTSPTAPASAHRCPRVGSAPARRPRPPASRRSPRSSRGPSCAPTA